MGLAGDSNQAPPSVRLVDGDDASGMAVMLADLLADNLGDYAGRARVARGVRGPVVMTAADRDRSVTVTFAGREITVTDGALPGAPQVSGEWLDLAQLCSGRLSPYKAVAERRVHLHGLARPDLLAAVGFVMSVPASYYDDEAPDRRTRRRLVIAAVALAAVGVTIVIVCRR